VKTRVVFDCMIFLQAAAAPHRVHSCFAAARDYDLEVCLSADTLAEIRDVLSRPALRAKFPALTSAAVASFLSGVVAQSTMISDIEPRCALPRDPKDEKWLDLAIAAAAKYLITRDRDLLDLMANPSDCPSLFAANPSLEIIDPSALLLRVTSK
jgi:putative PIN family toxin of toxin-antitoxin system